MSSHPPFWEMMFVHMRNVIFGPILHNDVLSSFQGIRLGKMKCSIIENFISSQGNIILCGNVICIIVSLCHCVIVLLCPVLESAFPHLWSVKRKQKLSFKLFNLSIYVWLLMLSSVSMILQLLIVASFCR